MTCDICYHEIEEEEAEIKTETFTVELQNGETTQVTEQYWVCHQCLNS